MTLREMTVEDLPQLEILEKECFPADPWPKEGFLGYLMKDYALFLVVEEKRQLLGYCGMLLIQDEGDIINIAVHPQRRREGIGHFMLDGMLRISSEMGVKAIHLEVRQGNGTARRLYERMGFVQDGLRKDYYSNPKENAILMTRYESS